MSATDSPRLRVAGRPSLRLRRKEGKKRLFQTLFTACGREGGRAKQRPGESIIQAMSLPNLFCQAFLTNPLTLQQHIHSIVKRTSP